MAGSTKQGREQGMTKVGPTIIQSGPKLSREAFRQRVRSLQEQINQAERRVSTEYEALHDLLIDEVCGGNPRIAIDPDVLTTPELVALRERAGAGLTLEHDDLMLHLKVAGISRLETEIAFSALPFGKKRVLVSLATDPARRDQFKALVKRAMPESVGIKELRAMVAKAALPPKDRGGRPRGPGPATTLRHVEGVTPLADPAQRAKVVKRVNEAPKKVREAFRKDVTAAIAGLQAMLDDLDD